jgi:hypothetical protein
MSSTSATPGYLSSISDKERLGMTWQGAATASDLGDQVLALRKGASRLQTTVVIFGLLAFLANAQPRAA